MHYRRKPKDPSSTPKNLPKVLPLSLKPESNQNCNEKFGSLIHNGILLKDSLKGLEFGYQGSNM